MTFNPSAPNTLGLEWPVTTESSTALDAPTKALAFKLASSTAQTITTLHLPHTWAGPSSGYGKLWADFYPLNDAVATDETVTSYSPNEQIANDGDWVSSADWSSTSNLHTRIDDADDSVDPWTDYMGNANWGGEALARFGFNSAGFTSTRRVKSITFEVRAMVPYWANGGAKLTLEHWYGSTRKAVLGTITPPADEQWRTYTLGPFYLDANDDGPWSAATIIDFDGGSTKDNIALRGLYTVKVTRLTMKVTHITDKRVAFGGMARQTVRPSGMQTNLPITLAASWSKASATDYLAVVRRLDDPNVGAPATTLTPSLHWLDSGAASPHGQGAIFTGLELDAAGCPTSVGSASTRTAGFWLGTSGGAQSVDSQPYYDLATSEVSSATAGTGPSQLFTATSSVPNYRRVRALVGVNPAAMPTDDLVFGVYRTSDNAQMGGFATLEVADLADPSKATVKGTFGTLTVYEVTVTMATSTTLVAAASYYVALFSSTAPANAWRALYLESWATHTLTGNITLGGSTDYLYQASGSVTTADLCVTVGSVPTAPASITVTLEPLALPNGNTMQFARVEWAATSLTTSFLRYDVERSIDGGTSWTAIAAIASEADDDFDDYEGPSSVATTYRVRVVRSDGAASDWTTQSGTVTPAMSSGLCVFTSNADPSITTGFWLLGDTIDLDFLKAGKTVIVDLHGRDFSVGFKPLTRSGFRWPFTVVVHADRTAPPSSGAGVRGFDPVRDVAEANVPYICLKTFDGELFFGILTAGKGRRLEPAHLYLADCVFTQGQADSGAIEV